MTTASRREERLNRPPHTLPPFEGPKLLILKEKHHTSYRFVPTEAHLLAIALETVTTRWENGWYGTEEDYADEPGDNAEDIAAERERVDQLKDKYVRKAALEILDRKVEHLKLNRQAQDTMRAIRVAVKKKHGPLALQVLYDRANYQYEGFELEHFEGMSKGVSDIKLLPRPKNPGHGATWVDEKGGRWVYDAKTIEDWIPRVYASLLYNVEIFQGKAVLRRLPPELNAYEKAL